MESRGREAEGKLRHGGRKRRAGRGATNEASSPSPRSHGLQVRRCGSERVGDLPGITGPTSSWTEAQACRPPTTCEGPSTRLSEISFTSSKLLRVPKSRCSAFTVLGKSLQLSRAENKGVWAQGRGGPAGETRGQRRSRPETKQPGGPRGGAVRHGVLPAASVQGPPRTRQDEGIRAATHSPQDSQSRCLRWHPRCTRADHCRPAPAAPPPRSPGPAPCHSTPRWVPGAASVPGRRALDWGLGAGPGRESGVSCPGGLRALGGGRAHRLGVGGGTEEGAQSRGRKAGWEPGAPRAWVRAALHRAATGGRDV